MATFDLRSGQMQFAGSGSVVSGTLASGQISTNHLASGAIVNYARNIAMDFLAGQAISGVIAVTIGSGGQYVVPAERLSGLRLPAVGVNSTDAVSGAVITIVMQGFVPAPASGTMASGAGGLIWVGSGGLLVNSSGFMPGASSGPGVGALSGTMIQRIGLVMSGGVFVYPDWTITQARVSGVGLNPLSGTTPASGIGLKVF
jgi:hypothetical protein